ncbi:TonB-dependent receptor [Edaphobacter modestus]|uniref:Carboxypeptidase family protein n=1 Tax=Edaphobacter modestus TaxID=388466 RepID=A0A4Q7YWH1_9BACT|nr:TonB-dependent receptor [Edaphobacter modestus]RZU41734.1 carboxypeptidase family protein [Edaphobacter modestus]
MFDRVGLAEPRATGAARWGIWHIALSLPIFAISLPSLQAQTSVDGVVRGTAFDTTGAAVAGARISIEDDRRNLVFNTMSDPQGSFVFSHVQAGIYAVTARAPGFASILLNRVSVEVGGVTGLDFLLKIAGAETTVNVIDQAEETGAARLEQPSGMAVTSVIGPSEMETLPVNGRRWQSFALLTPAANASSQDDDLLSFRGLAVTQNNTSVDGVSDDQSFQAIPKGMESTVDSNIHEQTGGELGGARRNAASWRRAGAAYTFSQEAVREFRVSTQNYSAIYGHGAGGSIATISKSGTNDLHGTGFYTARSSAWGATNPFSIATTYEDGLVTSEYVKPHDLRQQFGGTVGGALVRNKIFYFYAFDQQRRGFPAIGAPSDPNFYRLTAMQSALLANRGVTPSKVNAALNYLSSLTGKVDRRDDQTINFGKLDWQLAARNRISAQYNRMRSASPEGLLGAPVVDRGAASLGSGYGKIDTAVARWTWTASAHLSNEVRFAYGRDLQYEQAQTPLPQEPAIGPGGYAPEIAIGPDGLTFGTPAGVGRFAYPDETKVQVVDTVNWAFGHHLLQAGVDTSFVHDNISALNNTVGTFHYDSGTTNGHAGGLVDWITDYTFNVHAYPNGGCPSIFSAIHNFCFRSFTQSFGQQQVAFRTQEWAGFVEDTWRLRPGLTLNAGLRYEYELLPLPQKPNAALDAIFGERGATSILPEDRNNFGPRIGASWAPFGERKGVVRIGYGVYYGRILGATVQSALVNTAQSTSATHVSITPNTITPCPQVANQGFGYVCTYVAAPPSAVTSTSSATVFSRTFRTPMIQQGSVAVERGLGSGVIASATYLVNIDRQLSGAVDINIAPSVESRALQIQGGTGSAGVQDGELFVIPVYTSRVSGNYGPVTAVTSDISASYNALTLEARRRNRRGLEFRVAWTWSKAIDQGQNAGATPQSNSRFDPFTVQYDKGLSRLNFPHKIVASAMWEPRLHTTERWLAYAANGWALSGIFYETSGRPYSYEIFGGTRLTGGRESINGSGGAVYLPTIGRNTLRLPDTDRLDVRLTRVLRAGERVRVRASVEAFNLANHVSYTGVQQRAFLVGTPSATGVTPLIFQDANSIAAEGLSVLPFGTYTASTANSSRERQIQMGLRLDF